MVSLSSQSRIYWHIIRWWEYGTKEQILHPEGNDGGLDGRKVKFGRGPHEAITIDTKDIGVVAFQCRK